jgi:hypothetical protein
LKELIEIGIPRDTFSRFAKLHDRYAEGVAFIIRQRELGRSEGRSG